MTSTLTSSFPEDFLWGVSTAAYQIEGAAQEGGRGPSIWDTFSRTAGNVKHGDTGDIASDHYHRVDEDIALLSRLGARVYRFSFSWSRILPSGQGAINEVGLHFYDRLIDGLLEAGIQPLPTLYHWDLPQALQEQGGWENRTTIDAFAEYVRLLGTRYGDRISMWTTINEPWVLTYLGNALGVHAPGKSDLPIAALVHHNILLAHAVAVKELRETVTEPSIGIALNMGQIYAAVDTEASRAAAARAFDQSALSFLDPLLGRGYPQGLKGFSELWEHGAGIVQGDDMARIAAPLDWLSLNEYHPRYVVDAVDLDAARLNGYCGQADNPSSFGLPFVDVEPAFAERTLMGWIIEPKGLRDLLVTISNHCPELPLYISENGAAFSDYRDQSGNVRDLERISYLDGHLSAVREAINLGSDVRGYFLWSFLDNFEWAEGYAQRFGLVFVDYPTGDRVTKESFAWYRDVIDGTIQIS